MKKVSITREMTMRDYINVLWAFENLGDYRSGKRIDLSDCVEDALNKVDKRVFKLSEEQRKVFDEVFPDYVGGVSCDVVYASIPKKRS